MHFEYINKVYLAYGSLNKMFARNLNKVLLNMDISVTVILVMVIDSNSSYTDLLDTTSVQSMQTDGQTD